MPYSTDFYKRIFLHVVPACIIVPWFVVKQRVVKYAITRLGGGMIKLTLLFKRGVISGSNENKEETKQNTK